jgi:hypothetical protein
MSIKGFSVPDCPCAIIIIIMVFNCGSMLPACCSSRIIAIIRSFRSMSFSSCSCLSTLDGNAGRHERPRPRPYILGKSVGRCRTGVEVCRCDTSAGSNSQLNWGTNEAKAIAMKEKWGRRVSRGAPERARLDGPQRGTMKYGWVRAIYTRLP